MKFNTKYHGEIDYNEEDIITFKKGMPGFEKLKKFILFDVEENEVFKILHSIEDENIGFIVVSPFYVMKDYEFDLDDEKLKSLNVKAPDNVTVYNTVTLSSKAEDITTNLRAPIIINNIERLGEQIILDKDEYKIKYPLFKLN